MQNFCSKCGAKLEEGTRFCPNCGIPIEEPVAQVPMVIPQQKKKLKVNPKLIGIGAAVVVVVAVLAVVLFGRGDSRERLVKDYIDSAIKGDTKTVYSMLSKAQKEISERRNDDLYEELVDEVTELNEYLFDECGENISFSISDIEIEDYDSDEVEALNNQLKEEGCKTTVSAACEFKAYVDFVGEEGTDGSSMYVVLVKEGSTWRFTIDY